MELYFLEADSGFDLGLRAGRVSFACLLMMGSVMHTSAMLSYKISLFIQISVNAYEILWSIDRKININFRWV